MTRQARLPEEVRQHMIHVRFAEPVHGGKAAEFYRIRLRRDDLATGGEDDAYQAELFQPETVGARYCSRCHGRMKRQGEWYMTCRQATCQNFGKLVSVKPKRGVIKILIPAVSPADGSQNVDVVDGVKYCRSIVLVLDRRYGRRVLDSVHRTAGGLGDILGIKIL